MTPLFCRNCYTWYTPLHVVPDICPNCEREAQWTTSDDPKVPWHLHEKDKLLLHALRIDPDA